LAIRPDRVTGCWGLLVPYKYWVLSKVLPACTGLHPPSPCSFSTAWHLASPAAAASAPPLILNAATTTPAAPCPTVPSGQRSIDWLADQNAPWGDTRLGAAKPGGTYTSTTKSAGQQTAVGARGVGNITHDRSTHRG
jgi:hypothetical protein